ncbi:MAG TPA: hypothetical protein VF033_16450, partial [Steroidobacteraceae bacterium]
MNAAIEHPEASALAAVMDRLGQQAVAASEGLAQASAASKNEALQRIAGALRARQVELLGANALDMEAARTKGLSAALLDRLAL